MNITPSDLRLDQTPSQLSPDSLSVGKGLKLATQIQNSAIGLDAAMWQLVISPPLQSQKSRQ